MPEIIRNIHTRPHSKCIHPNDHTYSVKMELRKKIVTEIYTIAQSFCYRYVEQCVPHSLMYYRAKKRARNEMLVAVFFLWLLSHFQ